VKEKEEEERKESMFSNMMMMRFGCCMLRSMMYSNNTQYIFGWRREGKDMEFCFGHHFRVVFLGNKELRSKEKPNNFKKMIL
jgi:hypothetical protein